GGLESSRVASISCSGGEASLMADTGEGIGISFPPLNTRQEGELRAVLGPMVALANPLDYHTYIWRDTEAMTRCFAAMVDPGLGMTLVVADFPRADRCDPSDWDCVIEAVTGARERTGRPVGLVASLPELMPEGVAERLIAAGVVPFFGFDEALAACVAGAMEGPGDVPPICLPTETVSAEIFPEAEAKARLAGYGLRVPGAARAGSVEEAGVAAERIGFPVVLKGEGLAHKSEAGAVILGLEDAQAVVKAARAMPCEAFLVEEMVTGAVVELLIGVVKDPAHGFVLTVGAGGVLTEIMQDSASLLLPVTETMIDDALNSLRIAPMLAGFRGKPGVDRCAIHAAIRAVEAYVLANADGLEEIEVNPLLCTPEGAIAADALMRRKEEA
ncbi:MAG: acetate--CoA ligase family protein, partial [Rhodobacteraceae bacterium]|nr:acetate--CoA ligase family protein [Paracoccaceae bacterium]